MRRKFWLGLVGIAGASVSLVVLTWLALGALHLYEVARGPNTATENATSTVVLLFLYAVVPAALSVISAQALTRWQGETSQ